MTDRSDERNELDGRLRELLDERGRASDAEVRQLIDGLAALPAQPTGRRRMMLAGAAAIAVLLGAGIVLVARLPLSGVGTPRPPDPAAFAGDPRLVAFCGPPNHAIAILEMAHLRDYRFHFPAAYDLKGLPAGDLDEPALVSVLAGPGSGGRLDESPAPSSADSPNVHDLCIVLGRDRASWRPLGVSSVDTTGMTIAKVDATASVDTASLSPGNTPPTSPVASPAASGVPTWVSDIAGQLECDGPVANIGDEYPDGGIPPEGLGDTPETALAAFLGPSNPYASLPTGGFTRLHEDARWASFGHLVDGRAKAIVVLNNPIDAGSGWVVAGLRACDASEFDPAVPLTFPVTIWTDASDNRVSTETIRSAPGPGHCGWDSAIWLKVDGDLYFRDPKDVMVDWTTTKFAADTELPARAAESGYRSDNGTLWLDPGRDAYLVSADRVERWPRSTDPLIGCM